LSRADYEHDRQVELRTEFTVKDSGKREHFESGMVRDVEEGKTDYTLVLDGPMFERWAQHLTKGAKKYEARNWMKAEGEAELARAKRSLLRHTMQYLRGDRDEDHAAAIMFNANLAEYIRGKLEESKAKEDSKAPEAPEPFDRFITAQVERDRKRPIYRASDHP
jgi:hypothetical protein